jgi:hypothetical protein
LEYPAETLNHLGKCKSLHAWKLLSQENFSPSKTWPSQRPEGSRTHSVKCQLRILLLTPHIVDSLHQKRSSNSAGRSPTGRETWEGSGLCADLTKVKGRTHDRIFVLLKTPEAPSSTLSTCKDTVRRWQCRRGSPGPAVSTLMWDLHRPDVLFISQPVLVLCHSSLKGL